MLPPQARWPRTPARVFSTTGGKVSAFGKGSADVIFDEFGVTPAAGEYRGGDPRRCRLLRVHRASQPDVLRSDRDAIIG